MRNHRPYVLDNRPYAYRRNGGQPIPINSNQEIAAAFREDLRVKKTTLTIDSCEVEVSTVFLAIDHGFGGRLPVLWETMIFGGPHDQWCDRYISEEAATHGHDAVVQALLAGKDPDSQP
jgi:hypothetical protein